MAQTAPDFSDNALPASPLVPAEEFAHQWAHQASLEAVLAELEHGPGAEPSPSLWREADLDPEVARAARSIARRMMRANDSERAEVRGLARLCFRHGVGAMLAGAMSEFAEPIQAGRPTGPTPGFDALVARHADLPGQSELVRFVAEAVAHPMSNAHRVALAASKDRTLAGLILRLVNSQSFGLDAPIRSLERAVTFVGFGEVQTLALAVAGMKTLAPKRPGVLERAWRRGVTCGLAARLTAKRLGRSGRWLLSAGLLHTVGELALESAAPGHAAEARTLAENLDIPLDQARQRVFGFDAADLGGGLLDAWRIAGPTADLVRYRHMPTLAERPDMAALIHLSAILAHTLDLSDKGRIPAPVLDRQAWCGLCLPVDGLAPLAESVLGERFGLLRALSA